MSKILPSKIGQRLREEFQFEEKPYFDTQPEKESTALIIVDLQNDFLPGGALAVPNGDETIPVINQLQKQFDLIVLTQDWHPKNHQSFASSHENKNTYDVIKLNGMDQVLWPDHCVQGTEGADISSELDTTKASLIIRKGMEPEIDSYSGFFDNGKLKSTGLIGYLIEKEIKKVTVCGLAADFCVYYTAMDALDQGFDVEIVINATKAINPDEFEEKLKNFKLKGGTLREFNLN